MTAIPHAPVELRWSKFSKLTAAPDVFPHESCVSAQTDRDGRPVRIGMASKGLDTRYHGGDGGAMDAAMHRSGNLVFVAAVDGALCKLVEDELIWQGRRVLIYNDRGKLNPPLTRVTVIHVGDPPILSDLDAPRTS